MPSNESSAAPASPRRCPECRALRPETGGAFCNDYCLRTHRQGRSEEFEADVAIALAKEPSKDFERSFAPAGEDDDRNDPEIGRPSYE